MTLHTNASHALLIRKVMKRIADGPTRVNLPYQAPDGSFPIVIAFPNENMSDVAARVEATGDRANLVIASTKSFRVVVMSHVPNEASEADSETDVINKELSLGMFLLKYDRRIKKETTFAFRDVNVVVPEEDLAVSYA